MPAPYSEDLRLSAVRYYEREHVTQEEVSTQYGFSLSSFRRYWKQYKETGSVSPILGAGGRPSAVDQKGVARIKALLINHADATLDELCKHYNRHRKRIIGRSVMHRMLSKLNVKRKKKSYRASESDRPDRKKAARISG